MHNDIQYSVLPNRDRELVHPSGLIVIETAEQRQSSRDALAAQRDDVDAQIAALDAIEQAIDAKTGFAKG